MRLRVMSIIRLSLNNNIHGFIFVLGHEAKIITLENCQLFEYLEFISHTAVADCDDLYVRSLLFRHVYGDWGARVIWKM